MDESIPPLKRIPKGSFGKRFVIAFCKMFGSFSVVVFLVWGFVRVKKVLSVVVIFFVFVL